MFRMRTWAFSKWDISKEIPPGSAVVENSGFAFLTLWESPVGLLSPEFSATSLYRNRYPIEKRDMASKENRLAKTDLANTSERYYEITPKRFL